MKKVFISAALVGAFGAHAAVFAANVSGDLNVALEIGKGCEVTGATVDSKASTGNAFGKVDLGTVSSLSVTAIDANSGSVKLNCTKDVPYSITVDGGRNASSGARRLSNTTDATATVNYELYSDAARTRKWVAGVAQTFTGTGAPIDLNFYGRVPKAEKTPAAGTYTDSVIVTVSW